MMKATDKQFKNLMKSYQPEKAPANFTMDVMNQIYAETSKISEYKPVLNKWVLRVFAVLVGSFITYAMFATGGTAAGESLPGAEQVKSLVSQVDLSGFAAAGHKMAGLFGSLPPVVVAIFLSATFLLLLDQFFLKRKKQVADQ
ncbi:hypothetical protein [Sunxiuqinia elliptica]|nr:hypothetical protein [Sunxiuqinia elliptica]